MALPKELLIVYLLGGSIFMTPSSCQDTDDYFGRDKTSDQEDFDGPGEPQREKPEYPHCVQSIRFLAEWEIQILKDVRLNLLRRKQQQQQLPDKVDQEIQK